MHIGRTRKVNRFTPMRLALKLNFTSKDKWAKYSWMRGDRMMSAALRWGTGFRIATCMSVRVCVRGGGYMWHCRGVTMLSWTGSLWHQGDFSKVMGWNSFYYLYITFLTPFLSFFLLFTSSSIIPSAGLKFSVERSCPSFSFCLPPPLYYSVIFIPSHFFPPLCNFYHNFSTHFTREPPSSSFAWLDHKYSSVQHTHTHKHRV